MTIAEFIEKYRIFLDDGRLVAHDVPKDKMREVQAFSKRYYSRIISYLGDKVSRQRALHKMKFGISAVQKAASARDSKLKTLYSMEARGIVQDEDAQQKIEKEFDSVCKLYPREYAYVRAKRLSESGNKWRRLAGSRAMRKLLDGEDYNKVLADMEREWRSDMRESVAPGTQIYNDATYSIASRPGSSGRGGFLSSVMA